MVYCKFQEMLSEAMKGHSKKQKKNTIIDLMLEQVEEKCTSCPLDLSHTANNKTVSSIEASERGEGVKRFYSIDALFKDLTGK